MIFKAAEIDFPSSANAATTIVGSFSPFFDNDKEKGACVSKKINVPH